MAEPISEFLVSIGFATDPSAAKKVQADVGKTEAAITATAAAESAKRTGIEEKSSDARVSLAEMLGRLLAVEERKLTDARDKLRKGEDEKDQKRQDEAAKKATARREAALKSMQAGALKLAAFATKAVLAVEATALGIVYAADRAAQAFERLNYLSQRSGAAPASVTAFGYAASQLGSSAEAADAALGDFGKKLKTYPGYAEALGKLLGKSVKDANGNLRDTGELATELGAKLAQIQKENGPNGRALALAYAKLHGFDDEGLVNAIQNPEFARREEERNRINKAVGADPAAAAAAGSAFEQSMRKIEAVVDAIKTKVETGVFKGLQPELDKLSDWGMAHGEQIAATIEKVVKQIVAFARAILDDLTKVDWDKWFGRLESLASGFDKVAHALTDEGGATAAIGLFAVAITAKLLSPLGTLVSLLTSALGLIPRVALAFGLGNPITVAAGAILGAGGVAGAMKAPMVDEYGRVTGNWGGDADHPYGGSTGDGAHLRHRKAHNPQGIGSRLWNWGKEKLGLGKSGANDNADVRAYIAKAAAARGIDPNVALAVAGSEGLHGYDPSKPDKGGDQGTSFGPYQLHYKSDIPGLTNAGMGDDFTRATGKHASDPNTWKDQIDFALDHAAKQGWGAWHGAARVGIPNMAGIGGTPSAPLPDGTVAGDISSRANYSHGQLAETKGLIFHHTGGGGAPEGVVDTLNQRGLGVQYVMDRDGKIVRTLPEGARGAHIMRSEINDLNNDNTQGVEVIAKDDKDVTPAQIASGKAFAEAMAKKYPGLQVFGHGEVNPSHKQADEGHAIVAALREDLGKPAVDPNYKPAPIPMEQRSLRGYAGNDTPAEHGFSLIGSAEAKEGSVPPPIGDVGRMDRTRGAAEIPHLDKSAQRPNALIDLYKSAASKPLKVELTDASAAKIGDHASKAGQTALSPERQKLADAMNTAKRHALVQHLVDLQKSGRLAEHATPWLNHHHPLGVSPAMLHQIDNSTRRGDTHVSKNETFHIHGGDPRQMLAEAKRQAGRGNADLVRNLQSSEA